MDTQTQDLINSAQTQAQANNQWSAEQAQKQMDFQTSSNAIAMAFNRDEAQKNRDYQERMSNSAHQREVQDLIKAGLNPVLSAKLGGASSPVGNSAQGVSSQGSKGDTDTSITSVFGSLINAIIGQATALQTTAMNNQTALETTNMNNQTNVQTTKMSNDMAKIVSQISAGAQIGTANINATTQDKINQRNVNWEREAKEKYPQTVVGGASSLVNKLFDAVNTANTTGGKAYADKIKKWQDNKKKTNGSW